MSYLCYFYKLVNSEDNKVYIGSTKQGLRKRLSNHKCRSRKNSNLLIHKYMRKIGIDKFDIVEVKRQDVIDRQEQFKIEREIQDEYDNRLNIRRSFITSEERIEKVKSINIRYYKDNKESELERHKQWRLNNKDRVKEWSLNYNKINKDKILERDRIRYHRDRIKIRERRRQQYKEKKIKERSLSI